MPLDGLPDATLFVIAIALACPSVSTTIPPLSLLTAPRSVSFTFATRTIPATTMPDRLCVAIELVIAVSEMSLASPPTRMLLAFVVVRRAAFDLNAGNGRRRVDLDPAPSVLRPDRIGDAHLGDDASSILDALFDVLGREEVVDRRTRHRLPGSPAERRRTRERAIPGNPRTVRFATVTFASGTPGAVANRSLGDRRRPPAVELPARAPRLRRRRRRSSRRDPRSRGAPRRAESSRARRAERRQDRSRSCRDPGLPRWR